MPVPIILAVAASTGVTAAIGGAVGAAIVGSAVSAGVATAIGTAVIAGGITAAEGGDASDVLKSAVIGGVTAGVGSSIASSVASDVAFNAIANGVGGSTAVVLGNAVGGSVAGAVLNSVGAVVRGVDPLEAALKGAIAGGTMSGVNSLLSEVTARVPGFDELPRPAQSAVKSGLAAELTGGNAAEAVGGSLLDDAISWATSETLKTSATINTAQKKYKSEFGKDIPEAQIEKAIETGGFEFLVASTDSLADILSTLDDTQKAKAISKVESSAIEFEDAVNYTPKKWLEELSLGEFPTVYIKGEREKGWKHTTDDNGYTVMWNEDKGLVQLYDENDQLIKSLTDQFKKDGNGNVIGRNLDYYLTVAQDSFWRAGQQTASLIADVLPAMAAKAVGNEDYFKKQMSEAQAVMERVKRDYPSRVPSYKNVNDLGSAATYVLESVMEGVVTTAPTLLMGGAAGVAARASAKAAMDAAIKKELAEQATKGVFGAEAIAAAQSAASRAGLAVAAKYTTPAILAGSASQNIPEVFKNVYDAKSGKVDLKDLAISTVVGSFNAALDAVLPSAIVDRLNLSKIPVDEVIGAWYKTAAKEGGAAFIKEGGTEVLQEMSSAGAESFLAENKDFFTSENLERFVNAGLKGGIGGSTISTGFALGQDAANAGKSLGPSEIIQQGMDKTTPAEYLAASQMFRDSGFKASASDIAAVTGGNAELQSDALRSALDAYMDPRVVDEQEARQALIDLGYTNPDQSEVRAFVGQKDEASTLKEIETQYNPRATTVGEARQMMRDLGYTNFTDAEALSLAGKISETEALEKAKQYVDPRQVTRQEAVDFFASIPGYVPTEQDIASFVRQGADVNQDAVRSEIEQYINPRLVTEQEVIDAYTALGLPKPTQADIDKLVGQYEQELLAGKAKENLGTAQFNVTAAEQEATRQALAELETQSKSQYDALTASQKAEADARLAQGQTLQEAIAAAQATTSGQISELDARTKAQYDALTDAQKAEADARLAQGQSLQDAIAAAQQSTTTQINELEAQTTEQYNALNAAQKALADNLMAQGETMQAAIAAATEQTQGQINTLSADMQAKYDALTAEQKALANDMAQQGMDLNAAINLAQQQTQAQITGLGQQVDARINELMQQGQTYQQATQQAIGELNQQNQQLQGLVGTQGRQATQADIDVMSQMLGGQRPVDLTYDVTGDKQVTQADIDFLSQVVSGVKTDYTPPVGSFLGPTGLYGQLATNEAQRQADLQAQQEREQAAAAAAAEAQRRGKISATLAQGQQGLRQISQQLPQAFQQAQQVSTPIYGQMGEYLDIGSPLDFDFFKPSPEKQAATKQQQPTKIAAGGYIDDLLAGDMTADDLLNLLR
jgi:hypothetical protein